MVSSEVEKIFRAFAEKRKAELPRFTPDGIPITLENKFDDAIYNYLYAYWKEQSGEYDPKDDEIIMTKENSFTKNEKKFEQWLLQQYGMTKKEEREYTFKGNLLSLGEIGLSAWGIASAGATKLVVPGKFLASNADDSAKKALQQDTIEDAVEGTLKKEVAEEVAENTAKKEMADTAEDLSQKIVDNGIDKLPSAKGLYGIEFEDYLTKNIGGNGSFKVSGREFDGGIGNRWWEAKSGPYWENRINNPREIAKFKSDMGDRLKIAKENGATYELFSNTPIPQLFKDFLIKKGIPFTEILD